MLKKTLIVLFLVMLCVSVFAGGKDEQSDPVKTEGSGIPFKAPINIGAKNFTEQYLVGNLLAILLEDRGFDVELKTGMSSTVLREAMESGGLDLCMDYTGTQWLSYTGHPFEGESPKEMFEKTKASDGEKGLVWLDPIWCNNTYAIAITKKFSDENKIKTLSDFAAYVKAKDGEVDLATTFEFYARPDGMLGLQVHYDFAFKPNRITTVLPGLTFQYLSEGKSVATLVFGTDAAIVKNNWVVLQDDKNFWPPYDLGTYTRQEVLDANPGLAEALKELIAAFPKDPVGARAEMTALNARVDVDLMEPEDAAEEWLKEKGLIN